jgi:hypothetical protein
MSFAVCPPSFIRLAVAMCSASATLRGRPNFGAVNARCVPLQGSSLLTLIALAKQSVISKHPGPARAGPQPSERPRSMSPISQCHKRVRVPVNLTPDELSDPGGCV